MCVCMCTRHVVYITVSKDSRHNLPTTAGAAGAAGAAASSTASSSEGRKAKHVD